ncbi:MAG: RNA polymerase sigma factor [Balneolales bacterium]
MLYNEYKIIEKILSGDSDEYRILVNRYSPMVFHIIRGFEKDEDEVAELAQQIFVTAYERLNTFNQASKFSSWLHSIAANLCLDFVKNIRRTNKRFSEMASEHLENSLIEHANPHGNLEMKELDVMLNQALGQLPEEYSQLILLKYREGLAYEVISERLGIPVNALKVRAHRARKELKTIMEKQGEHNGR